MEEQRKNQKIYCTDSEKKKLVEYRDALRRGEVWAPVGTKEEEIIGPKIGPKVDTDIMSKLNQILEKIDYQSLSADNQLILRQALFLWQYETNKRADPVNKGTPQGYPVEYFIDWCKKNKPQWLPDEEAIANFVSQLRVKT